MAISNWVGKVLPSDSGDELSHFATRGQPSPFAFSCRSLPSAVLVMIDENRQGLDPRQRRKFLEMTRVATHPLVLAAPSANG
jgi:hypothetical protein